MRHRGDRRQRLAAEPERHDRSKVLGPPDLAGRMPLERKTRIVGLHAFPIVLDPDLFLPAKLEMDAYAARTGVNGVLDELLDDRRGTLDDLAGGDLVRKVRGQPGNLSHDLKSIAFGGRPRA
jgi:hypothetical protein